MKIFYSIVLFICLGFIVWSGKSLVDLSKEENEYKYDYAEVNKIKYGLFNLDLWKEKLFDILQGRIGDFEITSNDLVAIERQIEKYLEELYVEYFESGKLIDALVEAQSGDDSENKLGKLFVGLFRKNIEKQIQEIDFKSQIPGITDQLMIELERKIPDIKASISESISDMMAKELGQQLVDQRTPIYEKYEAEDAETTNANIKAKIESVRIIKEAHLKYTLAAFGLMLLLLLLASKNLKFKVSMLWLCLICIAFLALGLALPMIDLDARLSKLNVSIMGENIQFDEQVMYYQSQSIIDVTRTLLEGRGLDLKIVGLLILLFSIILPFSKMVLSAGALYIDNLKKNKVVQTIIFYLGKWSMADVFVVAIFMSYIGFYGLINSMLGDFSSQSHSSAADTVNYSKLSPGVIFFTLYCVFSIVLSMLIHRKQRIDSA